MDRQRLKSGLSLLFAAGTRPSGADIDAVLRGGEGGSAGAGAGVSSGADAGGLPGAMISHRPPACEGWLELLASGLTYELHGLAPAAPMPVTSPAHLFGFGLPAASGPATDQRDAADRMGTPPFPGTLPADCEAVGLITGPHLAGGSAMIPVVRTIVGLAANLALSLPVQAVCWRPAECWMEPRYFVRAIIAWLAGGPFPALGLTAIEHDPGGFVVSRGLDFFSGQDVRVAVRAGEPPGHAMKLAIRVIDNIVRGGAIVQRTELDAPLGVTLIAEPSADGRLVTVWRGQ